jgi:hypothetical protein
MLAKCNAVAVKHKSLLESICVNAFRKLHTAKSLFDFLFCVAGVHFLPFSLELGKRPGRLGLSSFFCNIRIFFQGLDFITLSVTSGFLQSLGAGAMQM